MSLLLDVHEKEGRRFMGTPFHQTRKNGDESGASLGEGVGVGWRGQNENRKENRLAARALETHRSLCLGGMQKTSKARVKFKGVLRNK